MAPRQAVRESFEGAPDPRWRRHLAGSGSLEPGDEGLRFCIGPAPGRGYSNAQIDDYQGLPRRRFLWSPPLQLTVRARFSHPAREQGGLVGTAGFGFWNDPFMMTGERLPALPRAVWFFYSSPPSDMKLDLDTPGPGWKAATIDALRPVALPLALAALPAAALMNAPSLYRRIWPPIQRAIGVAERSLPVEMTGWHTYHLDWGPQRARFAIDGGETLLDAPSPRGPLGFVLWLDNQYLIATPWGRLRWGVIGVDQEQWLEVSEVRIEPQTE